MLFIFYCEEHIGLWDLQIVVFCFYVDFTLSYIF